TTTGDGGHPAPALAFGAPGEDIGSTADAGTAGIVTFRHENGEPVAAAAIDQNSPGISGSVEPGDRFGAAVELFQGPGGFSCGVTGVQGFTLVVGAPGEDLGSVRDAGMVHLAKNLKTDTPLSQNTAGVSGSGETGDQFGASLALASYCEHDGPSHVKLAVGAPGEDLSGVRDAGMVHLFRTDDDELPLPQAWSVHQDTAGVAGTAEAGDRFGTTLGFGGPWRDGVGEPLIIGTPGENVGSVVDAGVVQVFGDGTAAPGTGDVLLTQQHIGQTPETGDRFGAALTARHDYLYVGAPDDVTHPSGVVHGIEWATVFGAPGTGLLIAPGADGVPTGASRFGTSLA
ncbi:MAG: hypothetical protein ACRDTM_07030, partial [Micromonosporaceae bacterium]